MGQRKVPSVLPTGRFVAGAGFDSNEVHKKGIKTGTGVGIDLRVSPSWFKCRESGGVSEIGTHQVLQPTLDLLLVPHSALSVTRESVSVAASFVLL